MRELNKWFEFFLDSPPIRWGMMCPNKHFYINKKSSSRRARCCRSNFVG